MIGAKSLALLFLIFWVLSGITWFQIHSYYKPTMNCYVTAALMGLMSAVCEFIVGAIAVSLVLVIFGVI